MGIGLGPMDKGEIAFLLVGCTVILPLGARIAGNVRLARRLDLVPRFSFGLICLLLALLPGSTFTKGDPLYFETLQPVEESGGRILFGLMGVFLVGSGVRIILRREYDAPEDDDGTAP